MEFRVLGPVEAVDEGRPVRLGGAQQRRLLGVLLADADRVVPVSRLVDAVWPDDEPPEMALRTTRTYVSRLRAALGDGYVVTREPGYLIELGDATFDKSSFQQLIAEARRADSTEALRRYDDALALWRGAAFAEFAHEWWARPDATFLDELRLVAMEERIDTLLALDRNSEAVPELEGLVAAHPYRERFTAQLMVALNRGGREVEAHRAYQQYRTALAEDTGLEPSGDLAELARSIAAGDRAVGGPSERRLRGYTLGPLLGKGSFGEVYQATQPGLGREVALKMIRTEVADDASFVRRFEVEAQLVSRLEHPHVVPLYDFWREPGHAYLVFRLLRGGNAEQALLRDGPWVLDRVDHLVVEIGGALAAAHSVGVVHRDVKPSNVLFDENGHAYLADFGIAQLDGVGEESPDDLASAGSPLYVSPEQVRDRRSNTRSDQYSLASTVWELLTGEAAFAGPDVSSVLRAKLQHGLPSVRDRRPDVPEAVDAILMTAGAADPEDRFPSMADMLAAWHRAVEVGPDVRSTGELERTTSAAAGASTFGRLELTGLNPYKGLRSFQESDSIDFYGRSVAVAHLRELVERHRFVAVVGPSGSGKSSLVHAGLVPDLRDDERRLVASMVPGAHPIDELSVALSRVATQDAPVDPGRLAAEHGIGRAVRSVAPHGGELVLVVDQFEELWTVSDAGEREALLDGLAQAVAEPHAALRVIATVRADFFDRPLQDSIIGPLVADGTFGVTPLTAAELLEAIVAPAARLGVRFEPGLASELAAEVVGQPSALPLLQFVLAELFDQRDGAVITAADYAGLGGVAGAVAQRAEELYQALDRDDQAAAHELFSRLVALGEGTGDTRRRVRLNELAHVPTHVVASFGERRLLAFDHDRATREPTVEVAHEALLVRWPRLHAWIDQDREWLALRRHLSSASQAWEETGREHGELYRGARLAVALEGSEHHQGALTDRERTFLDASRAVRDADADRQRRQNRRLRRMLMLVGVALVVTLLAGVLAFAQRRSARDSAYGAETTRLLATARSLDTGDTPVAALLALEAGRRRGVDHTAVAASLQQILSAKPSFLGAFPTVGEYAFGLDGETFLTRTAKGVEVYRLTDHARVAQVDHPVVRGTPGRRLATDRHGLLVETAGDREVRRYQLPYLDPAGAPIVTPGSIEALTMSPDGTLVTGHHGGLIVVWDAATGAERRRIHVESIPQRLDLSADGSRVAVLTVTTAQVWDTVTGEPVGPSFSAGGSDIALSPNGQRAVVMGAPGTSAAFDAVTGAQTTLLDSNGVNARFIDDDRVATSSGPSIDVLDVVHGGQLLTNVVTTCGCDLAVSPDGRTVATGLDAPGLYAIDGREMLADALDVPGLAGASGFVVTGVSTDGRRLSVSAYGAGTTVFERDGDGWRTLWTDAEHSGKIQPDGRLLRLDPGTSTASIVDPATGATARSFPGQDSNYPVTAGLSGDGRLAVYTGLDGSVTVVDTEGGATVARLTDLQQLNAGNEFPAASFVLGSQFSPDGHLLTAASFSGAAVVWNTTTWQRAAVLEPAVADVNGSVIPTFDPSGRYLVASRGRTSMVLFDATTLRPVREIPLGVQGLPYQAAFDRSGRRLVVVLDTQQALTFDVDTGARVGAAMSASYDGSVVFVDDDTLAVPAATRGQLRLWHLDARHLEADACRMAGRNLSRDEWTRLGPHGQQYRLTCPQFPEPPDDPTVSVEQPPVTVLTPGE